MVTLLNHQGKPQHPSWSNFPPRFESQPIFYSYVNERCCWKERGVWGRRPSLDRVGTHEYVGTGCIVGAGYSRLTILFYFISWAKPEESASYSLIVLINISSFKISNSGSIVTNTQLYVIIEQIQLLGLCVSDFLLLQRATNCHPIKAMEALCYFLAYINQRSVKLLLNRPRIFCNLFKQVILSQPRVIGHYSFVPQNQLLHAYVHQNISYEITIILKYCLTNLMTLFVSKKYCDKQIRFGKTINCV